MTESEVDGSPAHAHESTIQEADAKLGSKPQDTINALLDLARLLGTIHASELIAANDNRPPSE